MKHLGLLLDKNLEIVKELNDDEYAYLHKHNLMIQELLKEVEYIDEVTYSFNEYKKEINDFRENKISNAKLEKDINILVSNYLTAVRAFLDHWETYIKRKFGKDSLMTNKFKEITSKVYDENFSYRFVYLLRNFVQHCGKCVTTINAFIDENDKTNVKILAQKSYLLENFDWKQTVKKELINMPDFIDINFYLEGMNSCIIIIHNSIINERMNCSIIESCIELLSIKQLYNDFTADYGILDFSNEEIISLSKHSIDKMPMNIEEIPMNIIEGILTQFYKNNFNKEVKIFSMKGKLVGRNPIGFPIRKKENLIEFYSGCEVILEDEKRWTRIVQNTSICNMNAPDKLFSVYVKDDFSFIELREMQALADSLNEEFWNTVIDQDV